MDSPVVKNDSDDKRFRVQITEQELLCKNSCGFYGTPQWDGFCSQCWRVYQQEKKYAKNRVLLCQDSIDEKRKSSEAKIYGIKSLLPRSPSLFSSPEVTQSSSSIVLNSYGLRPLTSDNSNVQKEFLNFLNETFPPNIARDLEKNCFSFMDKLFKYWALSKEDDARRDDALSEMVQSFYRVITDKIYGKTSLSEDFKILDFMTQLESYICDHAYTILFCTRLFRSEEETADLNLQERIRSLHWVTFGFLETCLDFSSERVQFFVDEAITEIVDLNSHRQVWKKLECLIRCSKCIFDALKESRSGALASADEFLPVLIYVILKANPPLIQSNLNFISRYALQYRIMRGESGYYFTNLSCALQFIKNMNAESLHLSTEEFDAYTNGLRVPPKRSSISSSTLKSIEGSLRCADEIMDSRESLLEKVNKLKIQIECDCTKFKDSVKRFLTKPENKELHQIRCNLPKEAEAEKNSESRLSACHLAPSTNSLSDSNLSNLSSEGEDSSAAIKSANEKECDANIDKSAESEQSSSLVDQAESNTDKRSVIDEFEIRVIDNNTQSSNLSAHVTCVNQANDNSSGSENIQGK